MKSHGKNTKKERTISESKNSTISIKSNNEFVKKSSNMLPYFLVFIVPVLVYLQTLTFGFTGFDDDAIITNNLPFLKDFSNFSQAFKTDAFLHNTTPFYRPLQTFSYMIDAHFSSLNHVFMFHLSSILLLGLVACALYQLLLQFSIRPNLALFGTLIYCVHPLFVSTIAWIPARGDLLLTLFALFSFSFCIKYFLNEKISFLLLQGLFFALALFCKETAILLPFLFAGYYGCFVSLKITDKKIIQLIALDAFVGIIWYFIRSKVLGNIPNQEDFGIASIKANLPILPESFANFVMPFGIAEIPQFTAFLSLAGMLLIGLFLYLIIKKTELPISKIMFCLGWFLFLLLPTMVYKHKLIDFLNHRLFLSMIGILLLVLLAIPTKWLTKQSNYLMAVLVFICAIFTFIKARAYANPITFYDTAIEQNPNSPIAYNNRGFIKLQNKDYKGATEDYGKASVLYPAYSEAFFNKGYAESANGDKQAAIEDFNRAIAINKNYPEPYFHRGLVNLGFNKNKEAIEDLNKFASFRPDVPETYNYLGMAMGSSNDLQGSLQNFNKAIALNPTYSEAFGNRSYLKFFLKDYQGALQDCKEILKNNPNDARAMKLKMQIESGLGK